jgi:hypothetical protein
MKRGQGRPEIVVALIDGPVVLDHPDLAGATIREIPGKLKGTCRLAASVACTHGTFVAGVLSAPARLGGSGHLSRMHAAAAPDFCGNSQRQRPNAERDS